MSLFIPAFLVVMKRSDLMRQDHRQQHPNSIIFLSNEFQSQGINLKANCLLQSAKCFSMYMCTENKHGNELTTEEERVRASSGETY